MTSDSPRTAGGAAFAPARPFHQRDTATLGDIATEGTVGFFRVLRRGAGGDPAAADLTASAALRALPGMGALRSHEVLARAHIREGQTIGELDAAQRVELCRLVNRARVWQHASS